MMRTPFRPGRSRHLEVEGHPVHVQDQWGRIDLDRLAEESTEIGAEVIWLGILVASAKSAERTAQLALDVCRARLGRERREWGAAHGVKATETWVTEGVEEHPDFLAAKRAWIAAEERVGVLESAKFALVAKARHLEALAPLLIQDRLVSRPPPSGGLGRRVGVMRRTPLTDGEEDG